MNRTILLGRLTDDPELRVTPQTNTSVVRFSLAVKRQSKGTDGIDSDFFNIVAWKQTAEFVQKYFQKGQQVLVEGNLRNNNWTDKDGNKRFSTEVHADHVYFADSKKDNAYQETRSEPKPEVKSDDVGGFYTVGDPDEDLPF